MTITHRRYASRLALISLLGAAALTAAAIGHAASYAGNSGEAVTIKASTFQFPATLPAGLVKVTEVNDGQGPAEAGILRLHAGYTARQELALFTSQSPQDNLRALQEATFFGGVETVLPGRSETAIINLTAGNYVVANTGSQKPLYRSFTVTAGTGAEASIPVATTSVQLKEMKFIGLPAHLPAGQVTFKVTNVGRQAHEMALLRLDAGKTMRDVMVALMSGQTGGPPPWLHPVGGMNTLSPHTTAYLVVNLVPGHYLAICFLPDLTKHGQPHAMEGMTDIFTVS